MDLLFRMMFLYTMMHGFFKFPIQAPLRHSQLICFGGLRFHPPGCIITYPTGWNKCMIHILCIPANASLCANYTVHDISGTWQLQSLRYHSISMHWPRSQDSWQVCVPQHLLLALVERTGQPFRLQDITPIRMGLIPQPFSQKFHMCSMNIVCMLACCSRTCVQTGNIHIYMLVMNIYIRSPRASKHPFSNSSHSVADKTCRWRFQYSKRPRSTLAAKMMWISQK